MKRELFGLASAVMLIGTLVFFGIGFYASDSQLLNYAVITALLGIVFALWEIRETLHQ
ncbi:MAG: hypothetical protein FJ044_03950 [Candidatus Cloacimonetes bacterium]|nr:hypothetical protein [Candidatus Cloacimonadota bacterium]